MSLHPARYSELERQPIPRSFVGPGALLILVCLKHTAKPGKAPTRGELDDSTA